MKVLYCVSSIGLGHAQRSYAIGKALKKQGQAKVNWVCAEPTNHFFKGKGEEVLELPLSSLSSPLEDHATMGYLNSLTSILKETSYLLKRNFQVLKEEVDFKLYDLVVCDEFWEVVFSYLWGGLGLRTGIPPKKVFSTDTLSLLFRGWNPLNYFVDLYLHRLLKKGLEGFDLNLFLAKDDAISHSRWYGILGERVDAWVKRKMVKIGPITPFDPMVLPSKEELRKELGYPSDEKLVIGSVGGTAIGKDLLETLGSSLPILKEELGKVILVLVCGPRLSPSELKVPEQAEKFGYLDDLYLHMAAADCVVLQAGFASLTEAEALGIPALVVPIEGHYEQIRNARSSSTIPNFALARRRELTPKTMGKIIVEIIRKGPLPRKRLGGGSEQAAKVILESML